MAPNGLEVSGGPRDRAYRPLDRWCWAYYSTSVLPHGIPE